MNLYTYCWDNPINKIDSSGFDPHADKAYQDGMETIDDLQDRYKTTEQWMKAAGESASFYEALNDLHKRAQAIRNRLGTDTLHDSYDYSHGGRYNTKTGELTSSFYNVGFRSNNYSSSGSSTIRTFGDMNTVVQEVSQNNGNQKVHSVSSNSGRFIKGLDIGLDIKSQYFDTYQSNNRALAKVITHTVVNLGADGLKAASTGMHVMAGMATTGPEAVVTWPALATSLGASYYVINGTADKINTNVDRLIDERIN